MCEGGTRDDLHTYDMGKNELELKMLICSSVPLFEQPSGYLLELYVLATSKVILGWVPTYDSAHS